MSAEGNNLITKAQSRDHDSFAAHPNKFDGPKVYGRGGAIQDPNAGLAAIVEHGSQGHLDFRLSRLAWKPNRYRRAKRRRGGFTIEHITPLIGTGLSIGGIR